MAIDISIRNRGTWTNEDQRWIGAGGRPLAPNRSIVLKRSALSAYETAGVVPSGLPLAFDADGLAVPYIGGVHEVQTVTITGSPTGGTFTLTYSGQTTAAIAYNATAAAVQAALVALSNIDTGDVAVTGGPGPGTPYVVTFGGNLADQDVAQMTATGSFTGGTTPAVAVTTTTAGAVDADETGIGHLFASVALDPKSTANVDAALFWNGEVITNYLPAGNQLDAAFRTDVSAHISYVTNRV